MKVKLQTVFLIVTVATVLATIGIVWFGYINHTSDRLYFSITQFDLPNRNDFTIGENSDVCYKGIPENYMTVSYNQGAFSYKINNTDSCLYYKINNKNFNLNKNIARDNLIAFFNIELTGDSIFKRLDKFDNEYYMLKDVFADRLTPEIHDSINNGEIEFNSFIQKKWYVNVRFVGDVDVNIHLGDWHLGTPHYNLVILDKFTKINDVGYVYADTLEQGTEFKIQFFKMSSWSVKKNDDTYLSDSIRSYFAKPVQALTEWGAGHVLIRRIDNHYSVTFPKAITTTIPTKKIGETAAISETGVYLKQMLKSYPMPTDFYIPAFSNALSEYVCELSEVKNNRLIFQKSNDRDTISIETSGSFVPNIKVDNQQLVTGEIIYRTRILNKAFYWSKHWALAISWFVLVVILFFSFPKSGTEKVKEARWYILGLFTLFWYFLNQKLLIAEQLTFTYPYFEKIYPVSYLTTFFSLFILFLLIILINPVYFKVSTSNAKGLKNGDFIKWKIPAKWKILKNLKNKKVIDYDNIYSKIIIPSGIILICLYAFNSIEKNFIDPIWNSYNAQDASGLLEIWRWQNINLLNDNHFTVFLMVGVLLAVLLAVLIVLFVIPKKWQLTLSKIHNPIDWIFNRKYSWFYFIVFILLCPIALRGNFATAFVVLILLYVLSSVMRKFTEQMPNINDRLEYFIYKKWNFLKRWTPNNNNKFSWTSDWFKYNFGRHKLWLWIIRTLTICCSLVVIGFSDFGFFINVFGIGITWIFIIFCCAQYNSNRGLLNNQILNTNLIVGLFLGFIFVSLIGWFFVSHISDPENIDYERSTRRIQNCIDPDEVKNAGYLYTESDMQWMEVMRHYAEKIYSGGDGSYDIYGEDNNFHQLVSSGQSPVILNDVSVPSVYLGTLRFLGWVGLLFGILAMGILVYSFSIGDTWRKNPQDFDINRRLIGRLLAGNMWIGVTLYLLASYYWQVPFTGRLIPGYGVDAVGEALEIIVLFAFMCALFNPYKSNKFNLTPINILSDGRS